MVCSGIYSKICSGICSVISGVNTQPRVAENFSRVTSYWYLVPGVSPHTSPGLVVPRMKSSNVWPRFLPPVRLRVTCVCRLSRLVL